MAGPLLQRWWRTEIHAQSQVFTWGGTDARRWPPRTPGAGARWGRGAPGTGRGSFPGGQAEAASLLSFCLREALDDKRNRELPTICQNVLSSHTLQNLKTQFRQKEEKLDSPSNINTHINLCVCKRVCTRAPPPTHTPHSTQVFFCLNLTQMEKNLVPYPAHSRRSVHVCRGHLDGVGAFCSGGLRASAAPRAAGGDAGPFSFSPDAR